MTGREGAFLVLVAMSVLGPAELCAAFALSRRKSLLWLATLVAGFGGVACVCAAGLWIWWLTGGTPR